MKFGIIQCSKCNHASGFELRFKSVKCPYCGSQFKIKPGGVKYKFSTEKELTDTISKLNENIELKRQKNSEQKEYKYHDFSEKKYSFDLNKSGICRGKNSENPIEKDKIYEGFDPFKRIAIKYKNQPKSIQLIEALVIDLFHELGDFSANNFKELLDLCGLNIDNSDTYLETMKKMNVIYEPKQGRYRLLEFES